MHATQAVKIQFTLDKKNPVRQTQTKLFKNQVKIIYYQPPSPSRFENLTTSLLESIQDENCDFKEGLKSYVIVIIDQYESKMVSQ